MPGHVMILSIICCNYQDDDWFDIYDPRNPLNKRRRDKDKVEGDRKEKDRMKMSL